MATVVTQSTGVFTGYKLGELRALVLRKLRVTDTSRYSVDGSTADYSWIDDAINRGQDTFVRQTKCLRTYAVIELRNNQRIYRLPEDFIDLMAAYYYDSNKSGGYVELTINTVEELNDEISNWRTKTGSPDRFYLDRNYGAGLTFGLYPIPNVDGDTIDFSSEYGAVVEWICPLYTFNQDYGVILRLTGADEYVLPTTSGVAVDMEMDNYNLLIEYYRLPQELNAQGDNTDQMSEIPREYQEAIAHYAAYDLLSNNPEDSQENKRSVMLYQLFQREVDVYINKRKRALSGRNLRARAMVWGWQSDFDFYKALP